MSRAFQIQNEWREKMVFWVSYSRNKFPIPCEVFDFKFVTTLCDVDYKLLNGLQVELIDYNLLK